MASSSSAVRLPAPISQVPCYGELSFWPPRKSSVTPFAPRHILENYIAVPWLSFGSCLAFAFIFAIELLMSLMFPRPIYSFYLIIFHSIYNFYAYLIVKETLLNLKKFALNILISYISIYILRHKIIGSIMRNICA